MTTVLNFESTEHGTVQFTDRNEMVYSRKCQPRDIVVLGNFTPEQKADLAWDICADIRLGQGYKAAGLMKGALTA